MTNILLSIIVLLQVYIIFLFLRIIENPARFVLLLAATAITGSAVSNLIPEIYIPDSRITGDYFIGSIDFSFSGLIRPPAVPWFVYVVLLALSWVSLSFISLLDESNEKRRIAREKLKELRKDKTGLAVQYSELSSKSSADK